ncbi:MAG TPA: DUF3500 domain-containing protein [Flavitalea sp.]|nr:DUF3500 domain-containing protein [Flavitalea sp.]
MYKFSFFLICSFCCITADRIAAQSPAVAAKQFISLLDSNQHHEAVYPFEDEERYVYHYFPVNDRKGLPLARMTATQRDAAFALVRSCIDGQTEKKIREIIQLEVLLKQIENRAADDHFRDPGQYYFTVFGIPSPKTIWGWRIEGHHVYFNFSAKDNKLVGGSPAFLGSNPAIVQSGPDKGKEVLREEKETGLALLKLLSADQKKQAIFSDEASEDIVTAIKRDATSENNQGITFASLNPAQQEQLLAIITLYVHRFTKLFASEMLDEIRKAGLANLRFAWAGDQATGPGHPHYYRIQGPTLIIEYDNTQNNGNHLHTVVRDLKHDFGGDALLEHYRAGHSR